jgi:hypothetical protein
MTITGLRRYRSALTSEQYVAARLAIKGLSQVIIASQMNISRSQVGLLIDQVETAIGQSLPRVRITASEAKSPDRAARAERRQAIKAEMPDVEVGAGVIETCGFCGLRWHTENWPDVAPWFGAVRCDLKIRRLQSAYIGSALGAAT